MSSREQILAALRNHAASSLPAVPPVPANYLPVTHTPEGELAERFTTELSRLTGKVYVAPDANTAVSQLLMLIGTDQTVIAWEDLPIPELQSALAQRGINVVSPNFRRDSRAEQFQTAAQVRIGITGADAGFATTGTLALVTDQGHGRMISLLPPVHIALLLRRSLYARLEDWIIREGTAALKGSSSIAFITGPSRTSDIEGETILGVHGPREIHVIIFGA
jgi:L-lactate dehydrogenase complex protein LldG